ncbi:MAG: type II secretion system protein GspI, partial [Nevskiales bacterium]
RAGSIATQNAGEIRQRQLADWVALDRLAEYRGRRTWLPVGSSNSEVVQGGMGFRLEEKVSDTPNAQFRRIDVRVFSGGDADSSSALAKYTGFLVKPYN